MEETGEWCVVRKSSNHLMCVVGNIGPHIPRLVLGETSQRVEAVQCGQLAHHLMERTVLGFELTVQIIRVMRMIAFLTLPSLEKRWTLAQGKSPRLVLPQC